MVGNGNPFDIMVQRLFYAVIFNILVSHSTTWFLLVWKIEIRNKRDYLKGMFLNLLNFLP